MRLYTYDTFVHHKLECSFDKFLNYPILFLAHVLLCFYFWKIPFLPHSFLDNRFLTCQIEHPTQSIPLPSKQVLVYCTCFPLPVGTFQSMVIVIRGCRIWMLVNVQSYIHRLSRVSLRYVPHLTQVCRTLHFRHFPTVFQGRKVETSGLIVK